MNLDRQQGEGSIKRVICAVRGGRESRATVTRAVELALDHDAILTFFHVVDAEFLGSVQVVSPLSVIYKELTEMAEFAMLILVDRAQRRGVQQVDYVIWEGDIRKMLQRLAEETHAEVLVVGRPVRSPGSNVFTPPGFEDFVAGLKAIGDLHIEVVSPE